MANEFNLQITTFENIFGSTLLKLNINHNNFCIVEKILYPHLEKTTNGIIKCLSESGIEYDENKLLQFIDDIKNNKKTYFCLYNTNGHDEFIYDNNVFKLSLESHGDNMKVCVPLSESERYQFADELSNIRVAMNKCLFKN